MATRHRQADDARHPDTTADSETPQTVDRRRRRDDAGEPGTYGFRNIEETEPAEGPGAVEPIRAEAINTAGDNSTFASRAKSRGGNKAVRPSQTEGKAADGGSIEQRAGS